MITRSMTRSLPLAVILMSVAWSSDAATTAPVALQAPSGITALSGFIQDTTGAPLQSVRLLDGGATAYSDSLGRFLLSYAPVGNSVLVIDARHAGPTHKDDRGVYEVHVTAAPGQTTVLPYTSYLPLIDHTHQVHITSPTTSETIVTNPGAPNLALHIPAGVVIHDAFGKVATTVSLTLVPANMPPFPLPAGLQLTQYVVVQPGGACLYTSANTPGSAQFYYPNARHELPDARATLFRYDPAQVGWVSYGVATVNAEGTQLVPDAGTVVHDFNGACPPPVLSPDPQRVRVFYRQGSAVQGSAQHD